MSTEEKKKFDAKLEEGVAYFEQMLAMMPDDRTTLEFLAVVYPQMGEKAKAEHALAELARVLVKEGDSESALALLPRLEECESPAAKAMAVRVKALGEPKPELVPEAASSEPSVPPAAEFARAVEAEALLAESLGEAEVAAHLRSLPDNDRLRRQELRVVVRDPCGDGHPGDEHQREQAEDGARDHAFGEGDSASHAPSTSSGQSLAMAASTCCGSAR